MSTIITKENYSRLQIRMLEISFENLYKCNGGRSRHFSFICKKSKIVSWGWNSEHKSHPIAMYHGYHAAAIHSELSAYTRFPRHTCDIESCDYYNIRIDRYNKVCMSKPCKNCQKLIVGINPRRFYFTNEDGKFERLY